MITTTIIQLIHVARTPLPIPHPAAHLQLLVPPIMEKKVEVNVEVHAAVRVAVNVVVGENSPLGSLNSFISVKTHYPGDCGLIFCLTAYI
ncbi:hypothetical protein [Brevibacillus laterosporus]|uniref:hypothetical protein n=1 Tax=Brevibacillus laterosporus TaxID=1465 RepID=UPI003D24E7CB